MANATRSSRCNHIYTLPAQRKRKKYVYPGKSRSTVPNLLRESKIQTEQADEQIREDQPNLAGLTEILFSDSYLIEALAEFERDLIRERTNVGRALARARGRVGG